MERPRSQASRNLAHRLLMAMSAAHDDPWTVERAQKVAGAGMPADACHRALKHLEQLGALLEIAPGVWRRKGSWRGTQADWYL